MKKKLLEAVDQEQTLSNWPEFRTGDTVRVDYLIKEGSKERVQSFEGLCIKSHRNAFSSTFTIRKIVGDIGVERIFPLHSPFIKNITVVKDGKVRQSRIFYIRSRRGKSARIKART